MLPQIQILVDGYVDVNPYTCILISSGEWTVTTPLVYGNQNIGYPQTVEDSCPGCRPPYGNALDQNHVDTYHDNDSCYATTPPDDWEADFGSGGEQVHVSEPITETAQPKLPSYHDHEVSVESWKDDDNDVVVLSITSTHGQKDVPLPHNISQIHEIRRYADRLIVVGDIGAAISQVVIINLNTSTISDTFLAGAPVISPDGRFIAFIKWFPPHGWNDPAIAPDDHAMLYDMTKSALANRPAGVAPDDDTEVGINVYPGNGNKARDTSVPAQLAHTFRGFAFWGPDSTKLAFTDEAQSSMKLVLVKVPGGNAGGTPGVSTLSLHKAGICPAAPHDCGAYLNQVKFLENGLDAFFSKGGYNGSVQRKLRVKYVDFVDYAAPH
ncbi:MAG TPA: hypothetical protein VKV05_01850 [Terriglobales bacterium]|nr:hypothetical protein [Terriglobales bacterium]